MTATLREQILSNLLAALQPLAGDYALWDHETRRPTAGDLPVINLVGLDHRRTGQETGLTLYELEVDLDCWVGGVNGAALRAALGQAYGAALAAASADVTLGGLAIDLVEQEFVVSYDTEEGHPPLANGTLSLLVTYGQRGADPYTPGP